MEIVESRNWDIYESVWKKCMQDYYWYRENPIFDWNKHEELEEMKSEFKKEGKVFLEAQDDGNIVGVFGLRYRGKDASLRRWEPATQKSERSKQVAKSLLTHALVHLSEKVNRKNCNICSKHP